jgi:multidrug resistance protein MdtO
MAFAFLLCVVQHYAAGSDMVTARDRIWGVLIGNVVSYLFFTRLWPVSVSRRIGEKVVAALRHLRAVSGASSRQEGLVAESLVQMELGGIEDDLAIARLEPRSVRPEASWIERQQRASEAAGALCEILGIGTGTETRAGAAVGERLGQLADAVEGRVHTEDHAPPVAARDAGAPAWEPFRGTVEEGLRRLEGTLETRREDAADAVLAGT